ncbi:ATP-binding protein [Pyxidicoccus sp. 3LFB2]
MLKKILGGLAAAILVLVAFIATRPGDFVIQRSATLPVPADAAFAVVNDLHRWEEWSPWAKLDPQQKTTYSGAESGTGAVSAWAGSDQVGEGRMTIEESKANELVRIKLEFIKPFAATNVTTFAFKPTEGGTEVTWAMTGTRDFMTKAVCLVMDMDKMVGADFEKGLASMKTAAETEAKKRAEAEAASRAKDQFLAMLGHELRNPLSAITSGVKVLSIARDDVRRERTRALVERQAFHLARLVDDLLDVARVSSGRITLQKGPMDLAECVRRAMVALESSGRTQAHPIDVEVEETWLEGDESRLVQVVTNLVSNALKYTPEGGRIRVRTRVEGDDVVLEVSDTGVGLPPEVLPRVFELFFQADRSLDRSQGGLGVGLTLVKRLVELHGGTIQAHSEGASRGSTFTVRLPRGAARGAPRPEVAEVPPGMGRRLLLVEDHADSRLLVRQLLEADGHTVFEAEDGLTGLAKAREVRPEVVLLDIGLPGMDGYGVARALRATEEGRGLLLIALTGYGLQEDRARALAAGFDEHLVKPVDIVRLREVLALREARVDAAS